MPEPTLAEVQAAFQSALEPVREQMAEVERLIAEKQKELADLQGLRRQGQRLLNATEPRKTREPSQNGGRSKPRVGMPGIERVRSWIEANAGPDDDLIVKEL